MKKPLKNQHAMGLVGLVFLFTGLTLQAGVTDWEADKTESPFFEIESAGTGKSADEVFPLKSTGVDAKISGVIVDVTVRQTYQNRGQSKIEAVYVFPASTRAAVYAMEMKIGSRVIKAKVKEKETAKQIYEAAKAANKTASLLEQHRPNVFQMNVANILPGDEVEVTMKYTEYLTPTDRVYSFVYPTVVGPRYSHESGTDQPLKEAWLGNPYLDEGVNSPSTFELAAGIRAGMPLSAVKCGTHQLQIDYLAPDEVTCKTTGDATSTGNRDLILDYRLDGDQVNTGLLLHEGENQDENFFLLTMQPPRRIESDQIVDREYIFVVDVSGSMSGFPINTAKQLMRELVDQLSGGDRFNILKFAGGQDTFSNQSVEASEQNLDKAIRWMDASSAGGGTELVSALKRAYALPGKSENQARILVIITDGYVSFEREAFELVEENLNQGSLFAFGIGSSVNRYLIDGMARVGQGEPFVVTDPNQSSTTATQFRKYISQPVMTNIETKFEGFDVYDVIPKKVPDVFADRPVTIVGKWRGKPAGNVTVSGFNTEGEVVMKKKITGEDAKQEVALPMVWAREKIAQLDDYAGNRSVSNDLEQQITSLGLTYNLLTRYTSFVAVDDNPRESFGQQPAKKVTQPLPLPQSVSSAAVGGGSTPGPGIIPLIIMGLASFFGRRFFGKKSAE